MFRGIVRFMDSFDCYFVSYSCFAIICAKNETELFVNGETMTINKPAESGTFKLKVIEVLVALGHPCCGVMLQGL